MNERLEVSIPDHVQAAFDRDMAKIEAESYALAVARDVSLGLWHVLTHWGLIREWARQAVMRGDLYYQRAEAIRRAQATPKETEK